MNEFAGILAKAVTGKRRYDGPMGKSDRAFMIGLYGLIHFFGLGLSSYNQIVFLLISILLIVSTYLRIRNNHEL